VNPAPFLPPATASANGVSADKPLIQVEQLTVRYGAKIALDNVTLDIPPNRIFALIGPSGCGKTSFLNCLNRLTDLIPGCRVTGRICIANTDVRHSSTDVLMLRRRVGMIFQKPNPFPFSIRRNLEFPLREHGIRDRGRRAEIVETVLRDVGLWDEVKDRLNASALSLSGGQQQRLCIARALALQPEILLLDEPCSALDPLSSGVVEDLIVQLRKRLTPLVVTHNLAQARRIADAVACFWVQDGTGRLIEHGPVGQVLESPLQSLTAEYIRGIRG
jgi:phosphate transport system ATP-binding protein